MTSLVWVIEGIVLIKDSFRAVNGLVEKEKLVWIYPERLMWISTHISGPNKYSQFIYQIVAENNGASRLDFTASHIEHKDNLTVEELKLLTGELCSGDVAMWRLFAKALASEYGK